MNKDNAKDYLPLVQAIVDGKTVQMLRGGKWKDHAEVGFGFSPEAYRIKPEPRECYVAFNDDRSVINARTAECETHPSMYKYVKMREVIE